MEVASEIEESLVVIPYLVMDGLNGSKSTLTPLRNLREKKIVIYFSLIFKLIIVSIFILEWLRSSALETKSNP